MSAPLEVGAVVRRVFAIYVDEASILFPTAAAVFVIGGIVANLIAAAAPGLALLAVSLQLLASSVYTGMVVELVADVRNGRRQADARQLLSAVRPVLGELIVVGVVSAVLEALGFFLLIPGLILLTLWSVAAPVVVVEHPGGLRALRRSQDLVRGYGWPVFGVIVTIGMVVLLGVAVALLAALAGTAVGLVAEAVVGVLVVPLISLASAVLYFELRERQAAPAA